MTVSKHVFLVQKPCVLSYFVSETKLQWNCLGSHLGKDPEFFIDFDYELGMASRRLVNNSRRSTSARPEVAEAIIEDAKVIAFFDEGVATEVACITADELLEWRHSAESVKATTHWEGFMPDKKTRVRVAKCAI